MIRSAATKPMAGRAGFGTRWLDLTMIPSDSIRAYLVASALVVIGVAICLALPAGNDQIRFIALLPAVMLSALLCGAGAGSFAVALSAVAAWYFVLSPQHTFAIAEPEGRIALGSFVIVGEATVALAAGMHWAIQRARAADLMLGAAFEAGPDAIIVFDREGAIWAANEQCLKSFGGSPVDIVGKPLAALFPPGAAFDELMRHAEAIVTDPGPALASALDMHGLRRDGRQFPVHVHLGKMGNDGKRLAIASIRDLSQQQAIASAIADYALPDALYIFDQNGRFLRVNQQAADATGYSREELTAMSITDLKRGFDLAAAQAEWLAMRPGESKTTYNHHYRKNGGYFPVEIRIAVLEAQDQPIYVAIVRDITERENAQERIIHLQKTEAIGQLTSGIAHDFNNVLATVTTSLELAQQQALPPFAARLIDNALAAALSGAQLTHRLLAFARRRPLKVEQLDINEVISGMTDLITHAVGPAIALEFDLATAIGTVKADRTQIENALLNLVINARDAMPKGGKITIASSGREVVAPAGAESSLRPGDYVALAVSDNGPGMSPEVLARAVEPFFSTKPEGRGTGLGLSIIDGFTRDSGGRLAIDSAPGEGTTVTILMPRCASEAAAQRSASVEAALPGGSETILVIEYVAALRGAVVELIEMLGYRVIAAATAIEGLELLGGRNDIALVFSNMTMPGGLSGTDLARRIQERYPRVKILLTSGQLPGPVRDASGRALFPLLDKPYRLRELAEALRSALGDGGSPSTPEARPADFGRAGSAVAATSD